MKISDRCPEVIMAPWLRAPDRETEPAITRTLDRYPAVETVSIAAEITGGVGDALIASAFLREPHSELPESLIRVFCHSEQAGGFDFHEARFVKSVQHASRLHGRQNAGTYCSAFIVLSSSATCATRPH